MQAEVFCKKWVLRNFAKFTGKRLCKSLFFNKVACWGRRFLLKKRLWHRCFPVNFAKFLRILFFTEHLGVTASVWPEFWISLFNFSFYFKCMFYGNTCLSPENGCLFKLSIVVTILCICSWLWFAYYFILGGDYMIPYCWDEISTLPARTDFTLRLNGEINFWSRQGGTGFLHLEFFTKAHTLSLI